MRLVTVSHERGQQLSAISREGIVDVLKGAQVFIFDFDGTLVDSNPIKRRAFALCFAEFPEQRGEVLEYCWGHHHTPRGDKFRYVYEEILKRPFTADVARSLRQRFEEATTQQIVAAPEIPGAEAFVRSVSRRGRTAVLSSTPQETLEHLLAARGWRGLFWRVRGAPVEKAAWLKTAIEEQAGTAEAVVFFGDTVEDAQAAQAAGCAFLGVGGEPALAKMARVVENFSALPIAVISGHPSRHDT